jgi:two-component system, LuxR family, sensor kinase FixL
MARHAPRFRPMSICQPDNAEAALTQRLRLTQFSVDHAPDAIFWITGDFWLKYVNEQAVRSLGYSRDELLSMRVSDIDPCFTDHVCRAAWPELQAKGYLEFESIHRRRDGTQFPVWVMSSYYRDDDVELSFACCRDITEKKAVESALRQANEQLELRVLQRTAELAASEARYQDLYHNAPDMFVSIDAKTGRVVQCNQTLARTISRPIQELLGRPAVELFHADCHSEAEGAWQAFLSHGEIRSRQLRLRCNRIISLSMSAVRDPQGEILLGRATLRDITDMRRAALEAEQHRSELAHVARVATTGEMAAGLAHELNQPLYALNNFAQGAVRRLEAGSLDRDTLLSVLHDIAHESQRAAEIIRSLRRYVGKREPQRAVVDLNESVRQVVGILAVEAERRQSVIEMHLAEPLPRVQCDEIQIEQVLVNLILNGMEAMVGMEPAERKVCVSSRVVDNRLVELAVMDRGNGFAPHDAERIFDAFYTTRSDGLGLGLAISRTIVEAHGGRLTVAPNHDRGVTARFALPAYHSELPIAAIS